MDSVIRNRVNDILHQRIALGLGDGGARKRKRSSSKRSKRASGVLVGGRKKYSGSKTSKKRSGSKRAGVLVGGRSKSEKGLLAELLKGLNAKISVGEGARRKKACKKYRIIKKTKKHVGYRRKCRSGSKRGSKRASGYFSDADYVYGRGRGPSRKSKRAAANNPWIAFVKKFAKENCLTYGEAMKEAGKYY